MEKAGVKADLIATGERRLAVLEADAAEKAAAQASAEAEERKWRLMYARTHPGLYRAHD